MTVEHVQIRSVFSFELKEDETWKGLNMQIAFSANLAVSPFGKQAKSVIKPSLSTVYNLSELFGCRLLKGSWILPAIYKERVSGYYFK